MAKNIGQLLTNVFCQADKNILTQLGPALSMDHSGKLRSLNYLVSGPPDLALFLSIQFAVLPYHSHRTLR
jgi:hypothetical protein